MISVAHAYEVRVITLHVYFCSGSVSFNCAHRRDINLLQERQHNKEARACSVYAQQESQGHLGTSKVNMSLMAVCAFRIKLIMSACRKDLVRKKTRLALPVHSGTPKAPLGVKISEAGEFISCIGPIQVCSFSFTVLRLLAGRSE